MKIIEAINSMITNSHKISDVISKENEYFFIYNNKYKWSIILTKESDYVLYLYPKDDRSLEQLCFETFWEEYTDYITYKSSDIKTREATESFSELYQVVGSKLLGVDNILDDIINDLDDDLPF